MRAWCLPRLRKRSRNAHICDIGNPGACTGAAVRRELHRLQALEARWLSSYITFWEWIRETHYERALWRTLGDQPEIGDVMLEARRLLVARLAELNEVCAAAQFSR